MESRTARYKKPKKTINLKNIGLRVKYWVLSLSKTKRIAAVLVLVLLVTATGASAWYYNRLTDMDSMFPDINWPSGSGDTDNILDIDEAFKDSKIINIALLGFDHNESRGETRASGYTGLPDTIMIAAINIETGKTDIISIPRDTYVPIYNERGYKDKINSANYWGWRNGIPGTSDPVQAGMKSQIETISIALGGVRIHYYVTVDMDAVVEIVDIIGGVWLDVPERTFHKYGRIIAEPGHQWFSGRRFLDYVRSREAHGGDRQRARKQQGVMISVFDQFKKANKLVNAPQVLMSVNNNVKTNLSLEQIMSLAIFGTQKIDTKNITTHVLEGNYAVGGIPGRRQANTYYLIDQQLRAKLVRDIWGINIIPGPTDVLLPPLSPEELKPSDHPSGDPFDDETHPGNPGAKPGEDPGQGDEVTTPPDKPGDGDEDGPGDNDPGDDEENDDDDEEIEQGESSEPGDTDNP